MIIWVFDKQASKQAAVVFFNCFVLLWLYYGLESLYLAGILIHKASHPIRTKVY